MAYFMISQPINHHQVSSSIQKGVININLDFFQTCLAEKHRIALKKGGGEWSGMIGGEKKIKHKEM